MTEQAPAPRDDPGSGHYEIRLSGTLDPRWAGWFEGLAVTDPRDGTTVIAGPVADQAALHAVLQRVRDLGMPLASLNRVEGPTDRPTATPTSHPTMRNTK